MINDYRPLYPHILLTALALAVALLDAFSKRALLQGTDESTLPRSRASHLGWLTACGALAALVLDWAAPDSRPWQGILVFDGFARAFDTVFLATLALVAAASAGSESRMRFAGEFYCLLVLSTLGLMLMAAAGGLLALYLGLELSTICLFALTGFRKRDRLSAEASLKMFVLGAVASAVILYGAGLVYGAIVSTGARFGTQFDAIAYALGNTDAAASYALWLGVALVAAGIAFKIAAAPFHLWAPDVYQGAPTMVSAYLSTASKAAGFATLLRFLFAAVGMASQQWIPVVAALALLSMLVGNLAALAQTNLKRLLAYSGVAQAGYVLVAVAAGPASDLAPGAVAMYLLLYAFTNVGGFLVAQAIRDATGSDDIGALRGLHRRSPPLAFSMLIVLFSLGGIPPLAGFVGKLYLFAAGWEGGQHSLVVVGALISVVSLYYYLMVARQVYINDPADDRRLPVARPLGIALAVCVAGTLAIGIYPRPWVELGGLARKPLLTPAATAAAPARTASD